MSNARQLGSAASLRPIEASVLEQVSRIVSEITGVQLGERQRGMVEGRLRKRILDLGLEDGEEYVEYLANHRVAEVETLVGLLTTHHTYFFREFSHFEYLEIEGLKAIVAGARAQGRLTLRVWSAAASTGQEAYSLSMFLAYHLRTIAPDFKYEILGTDVDPKSIQTARNGVYHRKEIKDAPLQYLSGNWMRGTGGIANYVKAKPSIKSACRFDVGNLLELARAPVGEAFDLIFCRNVFIYFTAEQIETITRALVARLAPSGLLFLGISESLRGSDLPLQGYGPSIYGHRAKSTGGTSPRAAPSIPLAATPAPAPTPTKPIRVLCVDDSPSVLTLLKQILRKENGYEVVGTAGNGIEAAAKVKELSPDLLTLDIHMPEMDGLAYLKRHVGPTHPPVIMVSSVSRDEADLAVQCLAAGASDYVEKPALANLAQRGEELRSKLGSAFRNRARGAKPADLSIEKSFAVKSRIVRPETKLRIVLANLADRDRALAFLNEQTGPRPPTFVLFEGAGNALGSIAASFQGKIRGESRFLDSGPPAGEPAVDATYLGEFDRLIDAARAAYGARRTSILVFGEPSSAAIGRIRNWKDAQILVEDVGSPGAKPIDGTDRVPATSFGYMSVEFLGKDDGRA